MNYLISRQTWSINQNIMNEKDALDDVNLLSSAKPEIIRCKDCRYNYNCSIQYQAQAGEEFYCGAAERRIE